MSFPVSCIVPVYNESKTVLALVDSLKRQMLPPAEVIIVDGGSTDNTVQILRQQVKNDSRFRIIEAGRAMPGKGRNIGAEQAVNKWIAFTDAGIVLDEYWLQHLVRKVQDNPGIDIVYGNFSPQIKTLFDKCATISYVPPLREGAIRTKSIVSCLLKKEVWKKSGGFPDWRATEDLVFMEKAEKLNYKVAFAPDAMLYWQLRPDLGSTYKKFKLYSKYNLWAGRQAFWHYGIARQYAIMLIALMLAIFYSWYWLLLLPGWIFARIAKRIIAHRHEFGIKTLFNPVVFFMVMIITLIIDAATFSGWVKAILQKKDH